MDEWIIYDFCSDVIILVDLNAQVLKFNKKAELVFNILEKQIIGLNFFEIMKKNEITLCFSMQNLSSLEKNDIDFFEGVTLVKQPTKQKYVINWTIKNYSQKGSKDLFILIGKDVSELASYKASLQDSRMYLKNIIENLPQYVYWKDKNFVYQGCNNLVAQYLGLNTPLEIIGKTDKDFNWNKNRVNFLHKIDEIILQEGTTNIVEDAVPKEDGSVNIMLTSKAPLRNDNNEIIGILGISFDITDRKNMEKELHQAKVVAEAASHAKSEFIANMSHDIRTPLTGIIGMTQEMFNVADEMRPILEQAKSDKKQASQDKYLSLLKYIVDTVQEDSQLLIGASDELLELCNEILETMRLESGHLPEEPESFNLHELVNHNINLLQPVASNRKLNLSSEIDKLIPYYFSGLRSYLDRTLLNLLSNALKFTEKGFVNLKMQLVDKTDSIFQLGDTLNLQIVVEDSGIGIPKDKFETIFEHFSRLTPSYQGLYKGAGLGLFTVKRYIEAMNATIKVESELGIGTRFIINLPLKLSDHSDREKKSIRLPKQNALLETNEFESSPISASVLVVEDNLLAAKSVQSYLKHLNCTNDLAENGSQALSMVQRNDYDLILMDIGLGDGMDGIETTKQIRTLPHSKLLDLPIIAVTGHADDLVKRKEALAAGMQDVCCKPLQPSKLEALLQQFVYKPRHKKALPKNDETLGFEIPAKTVSETLGTDLPDSEQQLFELEQYSLLDIAKGIETLGNKTILREILQEMVTIIPKDKAELQQAYSASNWDLVEKLAHRAKGGAEYTGTVRMKYACMYLERYHKAGHSASLEKLYQQLMKVLDDTLESIETWLKKNS